MAKPKTEEKQANEGQMSPKKASVRYPYKFVEKNHNKKSVKGKFQKKIQTPVDGTENTVKTDTGKLLHRNFISRPLFQTEKRSRKETETSSGETTPKNRHCLRGLDGKYGRWDEILRDILNGKLKIVQNRTSRERPKSAPYLRLKNSKKPSVSSILFYSTRVDLKKAKFNYAKYQ